MEKLMDINEPPVVAQILTKVKENGIHKYFFFFISLCFNSLLCGLLKLLKRQSNRFSGLSHHRCVLFLFCARIPTDLHSGWRVSDRVRLVSAPEFMCPDRTTQTIQTQT